MKLKLVVLDLELSSSQKRALIMSLSAAIALSATAAWADAPKTFVQGKTLKAADLNASFSALDQRLTAIEKRPHSRVGVRSIMPLTVQTNSVSKLSFGAESYDDLDEYDAGSSTFTAGSGGDYQVCLSSTVVGSGRLEVLLEGVSQGVLLRPGTEGSGCITVRAESGDSIDLRFNSQTFANQSIPGDTEAWLTISQLN